MNPPPRRLPTPDDHRSAFAAALAVLTAEFSAYLDRDSADPVADLVGYRQHAVRLNPGELHGMIDGMREAIAPPTWPTNHHPTARST
ncbi:hypothetical protein WQO_00395 [Streptomyces globisporus C-1027]|uniref:Uncharacterized protein n=1 Tax=Streptomyces globisporus C-1027 TaxID=1172567 RepID=A0A0U3L645_STRGL|nr:putative transcriptional regulator [Streptomyces globisporus]ALU91964.1 hypothetical protein WQO_00395 [Streptomyces globisporus C-1027]